MARSNPMTGPAMAAVAPRAWESVAATGVGTPEER